MAKKTNHSISLSLNEGYQAKIICRIKRVAWLSSKILPQQSIRVRNRAKMNRRRVPVNSSN